VIQHSPACERNRDPILEALQRLLAQSTAVLEISSGTGMHAVHMAAGLPHLSWQPSDVSPQALQSIAAWAALQPADNLRPGIALDVCAASWPANHIDAIFNANMIHIAPWAATEGLLAGAGRLLPVDGTLIMYGPFRIDGAHTAPSNAQFDRSLRSQDPAWGIRDLERVVALAEEHGLTHTQRIQMPANNQIVVYRRT
jgi:hypothetical protein